MSKPIHSSVKTYLNSALPKDKGGHVWAIGNYHWQHSYNDFIHDHVGELKDEHNLGNYALESPPYMEVFDWAAHDGNLPVPKEYESTYLSLMYRKLVEDSKVVGDRFVEGVSQTAQTIDDAHQLGLNIIHHDSRHPIAHDLNPYKTLSRLLKKLLQDNPGLKEELRRNPEAYQILGGMLLRANPGLDQIEGVTAQSLTRSAGPTFVYLEIEELLQQHPQYRRWLNNIEAVMDAGKKASIGQDALSAAILQASADPSKNTLAVCGMSHLTRAANPEDGVQGTFAHHLLKQGLPVKVAMFLDADELPRIGPNFRHTSRKIKEAGIPQFQMPLRIRIGDQQKHDQFDSEFRQIQREHAQTPTPAPVIYGDRYIERMHQKLEAPEMKEALSKLSEPRAR